MHRVRSAASCGRQFRKPGRRKFSRRLHRGRSLSPLVDLGLQVHEGHAALRKLARKRLAEPGHLLRCVALNERREGGLVVITEASLVSPLHQKLPNLAGGIESLIGILTQTALHDLDEDRTGPSELAQVRRIFGGYGNQHLEVVHPGPWTTIREQLEHDDSECE